MAKIEIINWEILQKMCKYFNQRFDLNMNLRFKCTNKLNKSYDCSWSNCNYKDCPFRDFILR